MHQLLVNTKYRPSAYKLSVEVQNPCQLRIIAFNPRKPLVIFWDRTFEAKGLESMEIKMPQTSEQVKIIIECGAPSNVRIAEFKKIILRQYAPCYAGKTSKFVKFAQALTSQFPYLNVGEYDINGFKIQVYGVIPDSSTPARIHNETGVIELSQEKMKRNTVPMNMAILLHEYSHFYLNQELTDEVEADLNALKIYLGLGYPKFEGLTAFAEVFQHSDTPMNRERYDYIMEFVERFDKIKTRICI